MKTLQEKFDEVSMLDNRDYCYNRELREEIEKTIFQLKASISTTFDSETQEIIFSLIEQTFGDFEE